MLRLCLELLLLTPDDIVIPNIQYSKMGSWNMSNELNLKYKGKEWYKPYTGIITASQWCHLYFHK